MCKTITLHQPGKIRHSTVHALGPSIFSMSFLTLPISPRIDGNMMAHTDTSQHRYPPSIAFPTTRFKRVHFKGKIISFETKKFASLPTNKENCVASGYNHVLRVLITLCYICIGTRIKFVFKLRCCNQIRLQGYPSMQQDRRIRKEYRCHVQDSYKNKCSKRSHNI